MPYAQLACLRVVRKVHHARQRRAAVAQRQRVEQRARVARAWLVAATRRRGPEQPATLAGRVVGLGIALTHHERSGGVLHSRAAQVRGREGRAHEPVQPARRRAVEQ